MSKEWKLESAAEMNAAYPDTFFIPSVKQRNNLRVGDFVKLLFASVNGSGFAERMWVEVVAVGRGRTYVGRLDNQPFYLEGLDLNDPVIFASDHVACLTPCEEVKAHGWQVQVS